MQKVLEKHVRAHLIELAEVRPDFRLEHPAAGLREAAQLWIGPPPTLSSQPPPQELEQMLHIAHKFDVPSTSRRICSGVQ